MNPMLNQAIDVFAKRWTAELGGHGHELNGHRCPCPRHGHGRGMDTKF